MRHFRVQLNRCRLREFLNLSRPRVVVPTLLYLPLKWRLLPFGSMVVPFPDSIAEVAVDRRSLPDRFGAPVDRFTVEMVPLGFVDPLFELAEISGSSGTTGVAVRMRHASGRSVAAFAVSANSLASDSETQIVSELADEMLIATANGHPRFDRPSDVRARYHAGATASHCVILHETALATSRSLPKLVLSRESCIEQFDRIAARHLAYMLERGLYREVKP